MDYVEDMYFLGGDRARFFLIYLEAASGKGGLGCGVDDYS